MPVRKSRDEQAINQDKTYLSAVLFSTYFLGVFGSFSSWIYQKEEEEEEEENRQNKQHAAAAKGRSNDEKQIARADP